MAMEKGKEYEDRKTQCSIYRGHGRLCGPGRQESKAGWAPGAMPTVGPRSWEHSPRALFVLGFSVPPKKIHTAKEGSHTKE